MWAGLAGEDTSVLRVLQREWPSEHELQARLGLHPRLHLLPHRQSHADGTPVSRLEIRFAYLAVCLCPPGCLCNYTPLSEQRGKPGMISF